MHTVSLKFSALITDSLIKAYVITYECHYAKLVHALSNGTEIRCIPMHTVLTLLTSASGRASIALCQKQFTKRLLPRSLQGTEN